LRATVRAELFAEIDATSNAVIIEQIYPSGNFYLW